jgi:hypothetical protein
MAGRSVTPAQLRKHANELRELQNKHQKELVDLKKELDKALKGKSTDIKVDRRKKKQRGMLSVLVRQGSRYAITLASLGIALFTTLASPVGHMEASSHIPHNQTFLAAEIPTGTGLGARWEKFYDSL